MKIWELLKASKGIPVADPMAVLWGQQYRKKHGIAEISGILPLEFTSRGEQLLDYQIYGNTVQNGTPAPETPAEVRGCGERTENLFDKSTAILGKTIDSKTGEIIDSTIGRFLSDYIKVNKNDAFVIVNGNDNNYFWLYDVDKKYTSIYKNSHQFTASKDGYIRMSNNADINMVMVLKSPTRPDHYIPYGYKIPVTVSDGRNAVTTPVYIGSEPLHKIGDYADYVDYKRGVVVRRIKKLVLTGNERYEGIYVNNYRTQFSITSILDILASTNVELMYNSHFRIHNSKADTVAMKDACTSRNGFETKSVWFFIPPAWFSGEISKENCERELRAFFATQYSAGTPVTVWYVLATPEEEPLENLLPIQTIKGSDILTVDTTVQPSEMYIKYKKG